MTIPSATLPAASLPYTGAVTGLKETLDFFNDSAFAQQRFAIHGDVFETKLLGQRIVFIRGDRAIADLLTQSDVLEGWWPKSMRERLGKRSLVNRSGPGHKGRRSLVGQLFSSVALIRYNPLIQGMIEELIIELREAEAPLPLVPRMRRFAFAVIATTVLGDGSLQQR